LRASGSELPAERVSVGLGFVGVEIDEAAGAATRGAAHVTAPGSAVRVLVVAAREDLEIARQTRRVLISRR
jgi:acetate kinase